MSPLLLKYPVPPVYFPSSLRLFSRTPATVIIAALIFQNIFWSRARLLYLSSFFAFLYFQSLCPIEKAKSEDFFSWELTFDLVRIR